MAVPSLTELRAVARANDALLPLDLIEYRAGEPDYDAFCNLVDKAIDNCARRMAQYPKEFDGQSEDQLSVSIIIQLCQIGFDATHDTTTGGHCDIVIKEGEGFLWLGEAKKVDGVNNYHISSGYDQLLERYATAIKSQDRGSLIVFCNCDRIDNILEKWNAYLIERYIDCQVGKIDNDLAIFYSQQVSERTGRKFIVRHKPISVYFKPLHE